MLAISRSSSASPEQLAVAPGPEDVLVTITRSPCLIVQVIEPWASKPLLAINDTDFRIPVTSTCLVHGIAIFVSWAVSSSPVVNVAEPVGPSPVIS